MRKTEVSISKNSLLLQTGEGHLVWEIVEGWEGGVHTLR